MPQRPRRQTKPSKFLTTQSTHNRQRPDNRLIIPPDDLSRVLRDRSNRTDRTPYYITGITTELRDYLLRRRAEFIAQFGRDYEDEDPQFWEVGPAGTPVLDPTAKSFLAGLCNRLLSSHHHPAHVHAIAQTGRIIFGCGSGLTALGDTDSCFDLDECPRCNFRSVPDAWTTEWNDATKAYEKWQAPWAAHFRPKQGRIIG